MSIFSVITLLGGLAFFLYGMTVMSGGLEKMDKGKLEKTLRKVTSNRLLSMVFGAVITIAIQSSSALTVMLVGLVNSGLLEFGQTIGVLMGSNIGTTLTAWILSLAGIESESVWLRLLKPESFSPIFALVGIIMIMAAKKQRVKNTGKVLIGFAILMYGMTLMSDAMKPLSESPAFSGLLTAFSNPLLAVLFGALFTGIIQSSAASVGILQALSITGSITYGMAIPIIVGQNIGTCITALLSSIGVSRNAKKVAAAHLAIKIIGAILFLAPFCVLNALFKFSFAEQQISAFMIAVVHTVFNVVTTAILFPFTKQIEKLINKIVPDKDTGAPRLLDDRLITVPSFAVTNALDVVKEMSEISKNALLKALSLIENYNEKTADEVSAMENMLDNYEDQVGTYMVKLSRTSMSESDSKKVTKILHTINDFERIGDHAKNLIGVAKEIYDKKIVFSHEAKTEMDVLKNALTEILNITSEAFQNSDIVLASSVEPLEQVIDGLIAEVKNRHIIRLQQGNCTIELGFVLTDLLVNYERVSDHCSNIAVAIIETQHGTFDTHEYLNAVKSETSGGFARQYEEYSRRFTLHASNH